MEKKKGTGLTGFALLLAFLLMGELISRGFKLMLPGNLTGLVLLFLALVLGIIKLEYVEKAAAWLLDNLILFFIPFNVGLITQGKVLKEQGMIMLLSLLVSTLLVMAVTAKGVEVLERGGEKDVSKF